MIFAINAIEYWLKKLLWSLRSKLKKYRHYLVLTNLKVRSNVLDYDTCSGSTTAAIDGHNNDIQARFIFQHLRTSSVAAPSIRRGIFASRGESVALRGEGLETQEAFSRSRSRARAISWSSTSG
jgi:hypothetical protein